MLRILGPHVRQFIFTKPHSSRAKDPVELARLWPGSHVESSAAAAIQYVQARVPAECTAVVCGSLYLIGEVRGMLE
jgi:folylpolyglutamate synthase/dihydropteroate synthase